MGQCVYCLKVLPDRELTEDHVIARAWYPLTTPENVPKWKVPSCEGCNNAFSKPEQEMLVRFGLCLDRENPAAAGIVQKALDSIDPNKADNEKEKTARLRMREKILGETHIVSQYPKTGVLPSFWHNWELGSRTIVEVPPEELELLIQKWTKGLHYCIAKRYLGPNSDIDVIHLEDEAEGLLFKEINPFASKHIKGPGVRVMTVHGTNGSETITMYQFVMWDQYKVWTSVHERP